MLQSGHEFVVEMAISKGNNSKSMQSRATVPALCVSGHEYVVKLPFFNVQRAITPKECNPE